MSCNCKQPCNPCPQCDDDTPIPPLTHIDPTAPTSVEPLDSDECCSWGCGCSCQTQCKDNCGINIQSTNPDCLSVDTSECWVVKLTPVCPPIVVAWDNVTVDVEDCELDNCSKKYIVNAHWDDKYVTACDWDEYPGNLEEKIRAWAWIDIDAVWCSGSDAHLVISVDDSVFDNTDEKVAVSPNCSAKYLEDALTVQSEYIQMNKSWCTLAITDKVPKIYYAKQTLWANYIHKYAADWEYWDIPWDSWYEVVNWQLVKQEWARNITWNPLWSKNVYLKNMRIEPNTWWIISLRQWIYTVWFEGSVELTYWIHAFRIQLLKREWLTWKKYTICESRYSAPLGYSPYSEAAWWVWAIRYVKSVTWWSWDSAPTVAYDTFNVETPFLNSNVEVWWWQHWNSATLWWYVDRVPVSWNTIVELARWDMISISIKISTKVDYHWTVLHNVPSNFLAWEIALLWADSASWDNGWECWFHFHAALLEPLQTLS